MTERFIAYFKPAHFYPVPVGTILRYRGHTYDKDRDQYEVFMDVIGEKPKDFDTQNAAIIRVGETIQIPMIAE